MRAPERTERTERTEPTEPTEPTEDAGLTRADRLARLRDAARARDAEVVAERDVEGAERVHLVLESPRCYRVVIAADGGALTARLQDEHGHVIAARRAHDEVVLGPVCPRWSGSFELAIEGAPATLLLERESAD